MDHFQITAELDREAAAAAEEACFALGAVSVTLADAADDPVLEPAPGAVPLWPRVRLSALFPADANPVDLTSEVARQLHLEPALLRGESVAPRDWEREWLKDFRPMRFGRRLWICPGGQPAPAEHAVVLELDPGLAFGTGTHATTALCLEWLDQSDLDGKTVLDYGCGSGILALAALRLGARTATAVDIDPQALIASRDNALRNALDDRLTIAAAADLEQRPHAVVLANILAGPLIDLAPALAALTAPSGDIVLAGMLDEQAPDVALAYRPWFDMRVFATRDGWTVLAGRRVAG